MTATTFIGHFGQGIHASRPAANAVPKGSLYSCTTHQKIYQSDGVSTWSDWFVPPTAGSLATDTLWDAKGDMVSGSGADTAVKTAVGADGTVWTADAASAGGAHWAAAGGGGAIQLLSTTTLGSDNTIDVSGISGSYKDLILVGMLRLTDASPSDNLQLRLNGDTSAHYADQWLQANTSSTIVTEHNSATSMRLGPCPANSANSQLFAFWEITIGGYASTTWQKQVYARFAYSAALTSGGHTVGTAGGHWNQTTVVNQVTLFGQTTANLKTASELRIYGRS